jgi:hypothetical protein
MSGCPNGRWIRVRLQSAIFEIESDWKKGRAVSEPVSHVMGEKHLAGTIITPSGDFSVVPSD